MTELSTRDLAVRVLRQQRTAMMAMLGEALDAYKSPVDSSPRSADDDWINTQPRVRREALNGILGLATEQVAELLRVADEHAVALEVLLKADEVLPIPMTTLVRSIHEAFIGVCWSVDPTLTCEQRMTRSAAGTLASSQGNLGPLRQLQKPPEAHLVQVEQAVQGMQDYLKKHGFKLNYDKQTSKMATSVAYGTSRAALKLNVTEASLRYMPGSHHMWSLGSGATHSRNWFTAGLAGSRSQLTIMVTAPLLDFADALVDNVSDYVGLDTQQFHQKAHLRRRMLLARNDGKQLGSVTLGYADYAADRDKALMAPGSVSPSTPTCPGRSRTDP